MSNNKVSKVRSFEKDVEIINLIALKLSGKIGRQVTNKEIVHELLSYANGKGTIEPDKIVETIEQNFNRDNGINN